LSSVRRPGTRTVIHRRGKSEGCFAGKRPNRSSLPLPAA
jgi:hypothetical protein